MKKILIICAVIALFAVNARADTVTFKSGKKVEGNIKAITNNSVTVDLYGVTEMTYDLADIQEINGQPVELTPSEITVNPPAETTQAAPETPTPPAKPVETAPVGNEIFRGVKAPAIENTATTPISGELQERIPPSYSGKTPKITLSDKEKGGIIAVVAGMALAGILLAVFLIIYIYSAICLQIIAKKTNAQYGWMAWIPIANLFLMCNIGNVRYVWLLLLLAGFVPLVGAILGPICDLFLLGFMWYRIALARGKEGWIGAITVIPVVGLFTMGYLAFSKDGNKEDKQGAAPLPNIGDGQPA